MESVGASTKEEVCDLFQKAVCFSLMRSCQWQSDYHTIRIVRSSWPLDQPKTIGDIDFCAVTQAVMNVSELFSKTLAYVKKNVVLAPDMTVIAKITPLRGENLVSPPNPAKKFLIAAKEALSKEAKSDSYTVLIIFNREDHVPVQGHVEQCAREVGLDPARVCAVYLPFESAIKWKLTLEAEEKKAEEEAKSPPSVSSPSPPESAPSIASLAMENAQLKARLEQLESLMRKRKRDDQKVL